MYYRRILLKLSGEALGKEILKHSNSAKTTSTILSDIVTAVAGGVRIGIVLGGGNWSRGRETASKKGKRVTADQVGMLGTVINALMLQDALRDQGLNTKILSAIPIPHMVEPFSYDSLHRCLNTGEVVIFSGGTGHPFVSTDSAASLRALEMQADILLKATSVNGIYDADPRLHEKATQYHHITYDEVILKELQVMDLAAFIQCRDHHLPISVFNLYQKNSLIDILMGKPVGTLVQQKLDII